MWATQSAKLNLMRWRRNDISTHLQLGGNLPLPRTNHGLWTALRRKEVSWLRCEVLQVRDQWTGNRIATVTKGARFVVLVCRARGMSQRGSALDEPASRESHCRGYANTIRDLWYAVEVFELLLAKEQKALD